MKSFVKIRTFVLTIAVVSAGSLFLTGCASSHQACVTPPPEKIAKSTELSGKAAADLNTLNAKGELSGNWKTNVDNTFTKLNDDNAVYYMLLEAIQCQKDKALANRMFNILEDEMKSRREMKARARSARGTSKLPPEVQAKRNETMAMLK